jgi:anti-sigma factor RsiW
MRTACEKTRFLLEQYFDGELSGRRATWVEDHLMDCPACSAELEALKQTRDLLQRAMREAATGIDLAQVWRGVQPHLEGSKPSLWERLGVAAREYLSVYKPLFASAAVAAAVAVVVVPLALREPAAPEQPRPQGTDVIIESIESSGSTAMVYDLPDHTKVIWMFEDPEDGSDGPSSL